ncbi:MAG TPA: hypothetical protein VF110_04175 [Burkholderiales bacterium]|jgi:hypothetical protein
MKAKLICTAVLALAPALAAAEPSPTETCIDSLASEPRLQVLADKVALARSTQARLVRVADRNASEMERAAIAVWMEKRNTCFDAGAEQRAQLTAPERAFQRSVFVFQQRLVADLQHGRLTYAEFNRRRAELAEAAGQEI